MDIKDKIVGLALASLIALIGWKLHETWAIGKQIKRNSSFVKQKLKQMKKRNNKKNIDKAIKKNNKNNKKKNKQE